MPGLVQRLQGRLESLPDGLQAHIYRVRDVAMELANRHSIDPERAELGALAHDVCRAVPGGDLLRMSSEMGVDVSEVEQDFPLLLHGPVGAELLRREEGLTGHGLYEAIRWHSTAHPSLDSLGKLVFLADKLDPQKIRHYPNRQRLKELALRDLYGATREYLTQELTRYASKGGLIHPASVEARNELLLRLRASPP